MARTEPGVFSPVFPHLSTPSFIGSHFSYLSFISSWRAISVFWGVILFRLFSLHASITAAVTHLISPVVFSYSASNSQNFLRTIAPYCLKFESMFLKFSPATDFFFCNHIILERQLMSDNPYTHGNLFKSEKWYVYFLKCPFHQY